MVQLISYSRKKITKESQITIDESPNIHKAVESSVCFQLPLLKPLRK